MKILAITGWWYGGGVRYRGVYSWYSPGDTSPNRVRSWLAGWEMRGTGRWAPVLAVEYERMWWCCTGTPGGWGVTVRVGILYR